MPATTDASVVSPRAPETTSPTISPIAQPVRQWRVASGARRVTLGSAACWAWFIRAATRPPPRMGRSRGRRRARWRVRRAPARGDLEHAGFDRLDVVTEPGDRDEADRVGDAHHLDLLLPHSDRLDEHDAVPERVEDVDDARGRARETAGVTTARHAADEQALVEETLAHPNAVAEDGPAAEGRRRVDGDDRDAVGRH